MVRFSKYIVMFTTSFVAKLCFLLGAFVDMLQKLLFSTGVWKRKDQDNWTWMWYVLVFIFSLSTLFYGFDNFV